MTLETLLKELVNAAQLSWERDLFSKASEQERNLEEKNTHFLWKNQP